MGRRAEITELTRVRVLGFIREREAIFWVFIFPMVLAAVLGFAFRSGKVKPSKIAVVDSEGAAALVELFNADPEIKTELFATRDEALAKVRNSAVDGMVEPDPAGGAPTLAYEPGRAEAATARLRVQRALDPPPEDATETLKLDRLTQKGSRYIDFLFPGLLGMNLMGTGIWGIGFAIADVRRRGFLRRLLVTPMHKSSFFAAFMLSRLVFLVMEIGVLAAFGAWVLGVPFHGDAFSFSVICLVGALTFAGLGILIASRVRTMEGASGLMNLTMMPMWLLSGVFFSYERYPEALHPLIRLLPLTALNDAMRAVMIDGNSILTQGPELLVMAAWCVVTFVVALRVFRWE